VTAKLPEIGELRHQLVFQTPSDTPDGAGGASRTWNTVATLWAAISSASVSERRISEHLDGVVTHVITLRYRTDISGGQRFLSGARIFRILAAFDPDERRRFIQCRVEEEGR